MTVEYDWCFIFTASMRRYEEQIRVLQEDLESEMGLRRRIEHEKQQLQMQIISLSERLTEAESGSESQLEINRKREAEMSKLRKLLEDVHNESEQQIHTLRTKHQTSMMELQEQIERLSRDKEKVVKEKSTMKTEISELYAQIEILQSEKVSIKKVRRHSKKYKDSMRIRFVFCRLLRSLRLLSMSTMSRLKVSTGLSLTCPALNSGCKWKPRSLPRS